MAFPHPLRLCQHHWCKLVQTGAAPQPPRGPAPSLRRVAPTHRDAAFAAGDYLYATIDYYPENSTILPTIYLYEVSTRSVSLRIPKKIGSSRTSQQPNLTPAAPTRVGRAPDHPLEHHPALGKGCAKQGGFSPNFNSVTWSFLALPAPAGRLRGTSVSAPQPTHRDGEGRGVRRSASDPAAAN